jgi:hypothetical protein
VGLPIDNNSFSFGTRIYAQILSTETQIGTGSHLYSATENTGDDLGMSDGLIKFLRPRDRIRVGPSSFQGYEGAFEEYEVTGVAAQSINVYPSASVKFGYQDQITGIGTNCPGGWVPIEGGTLTMGGITSHTENQLSTSPGYLNRHSVQFRGSGAGSNGLRWYFNQDDYVGGTYYRIGYWYQLTTPSGSGFLASQLVTTGYQLSTCNTTTDVDAWTELNGSVGGQSPSYPMAQFYLDIYTSGTAGGGSVIPTIDHIYVEHATQTDDETSGVYTFDDYPTLGSRSFSIIPPGKTGKLINNRLVKNFTGNDTSKRYKVAASFKDVTTTLRDNLEVLLDWQDLGKPLVLHHDIASVPPNLYGNMTITDTSMGHWSGGVCSFNIQFEEI